VAITYSLKKAAEESGLSQRTLQYAIAKGELLSVRVGRRPLIPAEAL
jgi:excisionase family DNA binding protein